MSKGRPRGLPSLPAAQSLGLAQDYTGERVIANRSEWGDFTHENFVSTIAFNLSVTEASNPRGAYIGYRVQRHGCYG